MNLRPTHLSYHQDLCSTEFKSGTGCNVGDCDRILYHDICTGKYNVVFTSPEVIVRDKFWQKLLLE